MPRYVEKQKQDSEMNIAADVQRALLPMSCRIVPGYEFFASYEAAQAVGGDYYDIIPLPNGQDLPRLRRRGRQRGARHRW